MDHILAHSSEPVPAAEARGAADAKAKDQDDDEDEEAQISIGAGALENEAKASAYRLYKVLQLLTLSKSLSNAALFVDMFHAGQFTYNASVTRSSATPKWRLSTPTNQATNRLKNQRKRLSR